MWIDSHAHIASSEYEDIDSIVKAAREAQVGKILIICCDLKEAYKAIEISKKDNLLSVAIGFHPSDIEELCEEDWNEFEKLVKEKEVVAIGEIGLDYYWKPETSAIQKEAFIRQINLANTLNKPIIVHSRDAISDTYALMKENPTNKRGVLHCFSSSSEMALKFVELGYYISLAGPVTFKNAKVPKEVAVTVPLERLLIETDCPYLTPHPHRGKRNEPSYVVLVGQEVAQLRGISESELTKALNTNYDTLFKNTN